MLEKFVKDVDISNKKIIMNILLKIKLFIKKSRRTQAIVGIEKDGEPKP